MPTVDLGMEEEAQGALERAEAERLARRQREQAEREAAQRAALAQMADRAYPAAGTSAQVMADVERDTRQVGTSPQHGVLLSGPTRGVQPMSPEAQTRIAGVEQRLQAGDRAGVEADTRRLQQGASPPSAASLAAPPPRTPMRQEAVTTTSPAPMRQEAVGTGSDPGMAMPAARPAADANPLPRMGGTVAGLPLDPRITSGSPALRDPFRGEAPMVRKPDGGTAAPRLDAGLPTDSDISDARLRDAIRSPFRALGRALQAGAGMRPGPRAQDEAEALEERRNVGMRERMAGKATARAEEREASQRDSQVRDRDAARALDSRRLDLDERRIGMQADGLEDERAQQRAALEQSVAEREARRSATSPQSQAAQNALLQRIATYRSTGNQRLAESLERVHGGAEGIRRMSAEQLAPLLERTGGLPQVHMRGRAGGGGGAPSAERQASVSALRDEARSLGVPDAVADSASPEQLQREILARTRRQTAEVEAEEILPGVRAGVDLAHGEARAIRASFAEMRSQMGALSEIESVASRYGTGAAIDRRAAGELAAPVASLRAMVARLQNTGVINPSEAPAIEAMLPNPQSLAQMTFGDLTARLRSFRGALERSVDAELDARGVDPEGRQRAIAMLRSGGTARQRREQPERPSGGQPAPAAASSMVRVRLSDGRTGSVPRDRLERALAAGAEVVE